MNREIYRSGGFVRTRWATAENPDARAGAGGTTNRGAKGRPRISIEPGGTATLLDVEDSGLVTRIWLTVIDRSREVLESVRIRMTWDGAAHPAVDIGLGAFFGFPLGRMTAFENAFFSSAEGRSFLCTIPMPFRSSARIELLNTSSEPVPFVFYEVDLLTGVDHPDDALYLHASWNRVAANALGEDFQVLPAVTGAGRFLGCCVGVRTNPAYGDLWWGEGEFKFFVDDDREYPSLCGTGTEDYIGDAWGQDVFIGRYAGCTVADREKGEWAFYRFHAPDPVYFTERIRGTVQAIGGGRRDRVKAVADAGAPLRVVYFDSPTGLVGVMDEPEPVDPADPRFPGDFCTFFRQDEWCATAYYYLDRP